MTAKTQQASLYDIRERIARTYGMVAPPPPVEPSTLVDETRETALLMTANNGHTIITTPVRQQASSNAGFMYLHGRFVEADRANRNGAYWSTADLELGAPTVAGGPLNWLHDDTKIIGTLLDGNLVRSDKETAATSDVGNYIESSAAVWKFLYPRESQLIEKAAADKQLFYSMECVSQNVQCVDGSVEGCQEVFAYNDYLTNKGKICSHLREAASAKRFIDPVFLGGAVIIPPVIPGWAHADVEVVRQAAAAVEQSPFEEVERKTAEQMVQQILAWANTPH